MCPNIRNAHRIQSERLTLECTSIVNECRRNFIPTAFRLIRTLVWLAFKTWFQRRFDGYLSGSMWTVYRHTTVLLVISSGKHKNCALWNISNKTEIGLFPNYFVTYFTAKKTYFYNSVWRWSGEVKGLIIIIINVLCGSSCPACDDVLPWLWVGAVWEMYLAGWSSDGHLPSYILLWSVHRRTHRSY